MKRKCEICDSEAKKCIYSPNFFIPGKVKLFKYDIVLCKRCGFLFADNIPSQEEYNLLYKNNSKYTYNKIIPGGLKKIYQDIFFQGLLFLKRHYPKLNRNGFKILDIGCSIGYILKLFKDTGFNDLKGIEPSLYCKSIAKELYGIKVHNCSLSEFKNNERFDLVIMTGVLEHIRDLNQTICKASSLLNNDGLLMIVVPNVNRFSKYPCVPFDEFSLEHINYFNKITLSNLLAKYYFRNVYSMDIDAKFYDSRLVLSFFKKVGAKQQIRLDSSGNLFIQRYISASKKKLKLIDRKVNYLINSDSKIVIWGTGSLTARLLASTNLLKANIKFFVDSNKTLQGKKICNIKILSPNVFKKLDKNYKAFISSFIYGNEIKDILINKYNFKGEIVTV